MSRRENEAAEKNAREKNCGAPAARMCTLRTCGRSGQLAVLIRVLEGTRTPVRTVIELWRGGVPPEEITLDLPHLLAKVFDALSYDSDHTAEINEHIEANRLSDPQG